VLYIELDHLSKRANAEGEWRPVAGELRRQFNAALFLAEYAEGEAEPEYAAGRQPRHLARKSVARLLGKGGSPLSTYTKVPS
jgi:hypothetical protein